MERNKMLHIENIICYDVSLKLLPAGIWINLEKLYTDNYHSLCGINGYLNVKIYIKYKILKYERERKESGSGERHMGYILYIHYIK
jgi:hypothetical protein